MEMFSHNQMKKQTQRLSTNTLLAIIRDGGGRIIIFESAVRPIFGQLKLRSINRTMTTSTTVNLQQNGGKTPQPNYLT